MDPPTTIISLTNRRIIRAELLGHNHMKKTTLLLFVALCIAALTGCAGTGDYPADTQAAEQDNRVLSHLNTARELEEKGKLIEALEQYQLVLNMAPDNKTAQTRNEALQSNIYVITEKRYRAGLAFHQRGEHERARHEFLMTLRYNPSHSGAFNMLTAQNPTDPKRYVTHRVKPGESVSKIAALYYGDYQNYPMISKFNQLSDARDIKVGQELKIPILEGVPFLGKDEHGGEMASAREEKDYPLKPPPADMENEVDTEAVKHAREVPTDTEGAQPIAPPVQPDTGPETATEQEAAPLQAALPPEPVPVAMVPEEPLEIVPPETAPVPPVPPIKDTLTYQNMGTEHFKAKKYAQAIRALEQALQIDPENDIARDYLSQSHYELAMALFENGDYLAAREGFKTARQYNESCEKCIAYEQKSELYYKEVHYNKGIGHFVREELSEAMREWELVQAIDPGYKKVEENIDKASTLLNRLKEIRKNTQQ